MATDTPEQKCPSCNLPTRRGPSYDGKVCGPRTCDGWRVVGRSKNGSPILRIVDGHSSTATPEEVFAIDNDGDG